MTQFHRPIESAQNTQFKIWSSLFENKGIKKNNLIIISGRKIVPEVLKNKKYRVKHILFDSENFPEELSSLLGKFKVQPLRKDLFQTLDTSGTKYPLLIVEKPQIQELDLSKPPEGIEVFCSLGDPNNLGAFIRTCEAFSVSKIILLQESANPFLPKALKTSSGTTLTAPLYSGPSVKNLETNLLCLDGSGTNINDHIWPQNCRLLMGEEGPGIPKNLKKRALKIAIPITPKVESLNASIATGIALFSYRQKHPVK